MTLIMREGTEGLQGLMRSKYSTRPRAIEAAQEHGLVDPTGTDASNITAARQKNGHGSFSACGNMKHFSAKPHCERRRQLGQGRREVSGQSPPHQRSEGLQVLLPLGKGSHQADKCCGYVDAGSFPEFLEDGMGEAGYPCLQ